MVEKVSVFRIQGYEALVPMSTSTNEHSGVTLLLPAAKDELK